MKVVYHGMFDEVLVPDLIPFGVTDGIVKRNHQVEVPDDFARQHLLPQEDNWREATPRKKAEDRPATPKQAEIPTPPGTEEPPPSWESPRWP